MLPIHLALGLALGWAFVRGQGAVRVVLTIGVLASLAWGVAVLLSTGDLAGLAGGTAIAAVNVILGAMAGGVLAFLAGQRARNRGTRA